MGSVKRVLSESFLASSSRARLACAMLSRKVEAVVGFLSSAKAIMGENPSWPGLVSSQARAIIEFAQSAPPNLEDATKALGVLAGDEAASHIDEASRSSIAAAITSSIEKSVVDPVVVGPQVVARAACQSHFFLYNYLTSEDWDALLAQSIVSLKMKVLVSRGLAIGLGNPSEKTFVSILAITIVAAQSSMSSVEAHTLLADLKRMWRTARASQVVKQTCSQFPPSAADFQKMFPGLFSDSAPPVVCRLSIAAIEDVRMSLAARKTHKSLVAMGAQQQVSSLLQMLSPGGVIGTPSPPSRVTILRSGSSSSIERLGLDDPPSPSPIVTPRAKPLPAINDVSGSPLPAMPQTMAVVPIADQMKCDDDDNSGVAADLGNKKELTVESLDDVVREFQAVVAKQEPKSRGGTGGGKAILKRPASCLSGAAVGHAPGAPEDPVAKGLKRLPDKVLSTVGKGSVKPITTVEWSRSQVLARVGLKGPGMSKAFKFKKNPSEVRQAAMDWLSSRCAELGVAFGS